MKLDFNDIQTLERHRELAYLERHFKSILSNGSSAVLIEAASGTGKSTLVQSFMEKVSSRALICYGKFEERTTASEPFAAIVDAMKTLIDTILKSGEGHIWGRRIRESLEVEIELLQDLFPSFSIITKAGRRLSESTENSDSSFYFDGFGNMTDKEWRFERLRLAMRSLFRCLSSYAPVVFCLDDLHWVDPDSLALIRTLLGDKKRGRKFLFLGTTRPLPTKTNPFLCDKINVFHLPGWTVEEITTLVAQILRQSPGSVQPLAECLHNHTAGNAFTVMHFLRRLYDQHLFVWDPDKEQWAFDEHETSLGINMIETPAEVVRDSLLSTEEDERLALMVAASFGTAHFEVTTIVHGLEVLKSEIAPAGQAPSGPALTEERSESVDPYFVQNRIRSMKQALERLAEKGFVIKQENEFQGHYKFAHDSVREAAYSLLPEGRERRRVHLNIGRQIRLWMDTESELGMSLSQESLVLYAAKHLNIASDLIEDPWELVDLAEMNYQAAEVVAQKSSFFPALEYLQFAVQLLGDEGWKDHYALAHKLSVALTRIQYSLGLHDDCLKTADTVLKHGKAFRDECAVYHAKLFCLMQQDRYPEALDVVLNVLKDLGQPFPRRFLCVHLAKDLKKTMKLLKGKTDKELLALPRIDDQDINDSIDFMERLAEMSKRGVDPIYFHLFSFRAIHLTVERGLYRLSTYAFMAWAWSRAEMGDHEEAVRFGKLALKITEDGLGRFRDTRIRAVYWTHIFHWRQPYRNGLEPMFRAIKELWEYSAVDYVHWHGAQLCRLCIASGYNLRATLKEIEKFCECLQDYRQDMHWRLLAPFHQSVLNFMGKSPNGAHLSGEIIDADTHERVWSGDRNALQYLDLNVMMVAYYFHDYERASNAWQRLKDVSISVTGPDYWIPLRLFYAGLVSAALSRRKSFRGEKRKAQSQLSQLRLWTDQGNVACRHMCLLLEAEILRNSSSADLEGVLSLYAKAGEEACIVSMIHHEALAYELAGQFIFDSGKKQMARIYFTRAMDLYETWGAVGKVEHIYTKFRAVLWAKNECPESTMEFTVTMPG